MTWLLCILLGISIAMPGVVMADENHAGNACVVESALDLASVMPEAADEQGGLTICSAPCGHCDAVMWLTRSLTAVPLPPAPVRSTFWPRALPERLDRPPRT
ncbi:MULTISPECIES: hypothetical protein [Halomonas]|uniref:DUF2946 domain-containing protein n=2 Tax=Halomonas TaxID=2745 RepID=A0A7W5BW78_9GAMM|nr:MULTISPECIES: hypothetical protein [Halomonas]MBB3140291.1 hypothetical protein [Halomonas organivorans]